MLASADEEPTQDMVNAGNQRKTFCRVCSWWVVKRYNLSHSSSVWLTISQNSAFCAYSIFPKMSSMTNTLRRLPNRHFRTLVPCCLISELISCTNLKSKSWTCTLPADLVHCTCATQHIHMDASPYPLTQAWKKGRCNVLPPEQSIKPVPSSPLSWGHLRATKNSASGELVSSCFRIFLQPLLSHHTMDENRYCERCSTKMRAKRRLLLPQKEYLCPYSTCRVSRCVSEDWATKWCPNISNVILHNLQRL